jgi:hypothetical protein
MKVEGVDIFGWAAALGATGSSQYGLEDLFAQDKQCGESSDTGPSDSVTPSVSDALYQCFAAELAQVVGGLAGMVSGHSSALLASHPSGQLFSREAIGLRGQCDERLGYYT